MDIHKTGEFIKALRKESNMTQAELAAKLNCTDKAISRWETGKGLPDADMLLSLSDEFKVSINEILLGEKFPALEIEKENTTAESEAQHIEKIISCADENVVTVLKEKENELLEINHSAILLIIACCIQVLVFFVIPEIIMKFKPHAEPVEFLVYGSLINFVFAGFIKDKIRWCFPLFVFVSLLAPMLTPSSEGFLNVWFAAIFGTVSVVVMGVIAGVRWIKGEIIR